VKIIILFLIIVSICFGQIQRKHLSVIAKMNVTAEEGEVGEIFAEDFEPTGSLVANWALEREGSNTVAEASDTTHDGSYSAKLTYIGDDEMSKFAIGISNLETIYLRGYMWVTSGYNTGSSFGWNEVVCFYDGATKVAGFEVKGGDPGNPYNWVVRPDGVTRVVGSDGNGWTGKIGTWTRVEFYWEKGTGSDGMMTVKVDGDSIIGVGGFDHTAFHIDSIKVGNTTAAFADPEGHIYWDDLIADSTGYPGAKP